MSFPKITKDNLLEIYNYIPEGKSNNYASIAMLERALQSAIERKHNMYSCEEVEEMIGEFDRLFDYEIEYSLNSEFDVRGCQQFGTECDSLEEALEYISGEKEIEEPEIEDCTEYWVEDSRHNLEVSVDNLRLKQDSDAALVELLTKAIASTGMDIEMVPQLMERVYREGFGLSVI